MFTYEIDERLGLMVGRHHAGLTSAIVPEILRATRKLAVSPGIAAMPKVELLLVDSDASHPGPHEREQIANAWQTVNGGLVFAMVTSSALARATLGVVSLLRGRHHDESARCAFATREEALAWIEARRPGVRSELLRLDVRRQARFDAMDHGDLSPSPASMRSARTGT